MQSNQYKPNVVVIYEACSVTDEYGRGEVLGYFLNEKDAIKATEGHGWWSTHGKVEKVPAILVDNESAYILKSTKPVALGETVDQIKRNALSKLTEKERIALKLK